MQANFMRLQKDGRGASQNTKKNYIHIRLSSTHNNTHPITHPNQNLKASQGKVNKCLNTYWRLYLSHHFAIFVLKIPATKQFLGKVAQLNSHCNYSSFDCTFVVTLSAPFSPIYYFLFCTFDFDLLTLVYSNCHSSRDIPLRNNS